jgi:hypothetical protein
MLEPVFEAETHNFFEDKAMEGRGATMGQESEITIPSYLGNAGMGELAEDCCLSLKHRYALDIIDQQDLH